MDHDSTVKGLVLEGQVVRIGLNQVSEPLLPSFGHHCERHSHSWISHSEIQKLFWDPACHFYHVVATKKLSSIIRTKPVDDGSMDLLWQVPRYRKTLFFQLSNCIVRRYI